MGWANVEKGNTYKDNEYLPQLEFIVWKKSENLEKIRGGAGEMRVKKIECVGKENLQKLDGRGGKGAGCQVNIIHMKRLNWKIKG